MNPRLFFHCAFEIGIFHATTKDVQQIEMLVFFAPGRADTIVVQLAGFIGGIPALHNTLELGRSSSGT